MLYKFQWDIPTAQGDRELVLHMSSLSGWLGRKTLTLDGQQLYRRGIFAGINHRIDVNGSPSAGHYRLKAARTGPDNEWRPTLYAGGVPQVEKLGTKPPHNPTRPFGLGMTVGLTYLLIFILFIMWFPIENMLEAANSQTDSRVFILKVEDDSPPAAFRQSGTRLPEATIGQAYAAQLSAEGGKAPLTWRRKSGRIPPGLTIDDQTGRIEGTPIEPGDYPLTIRAIDADGNDARYSYVIRVITPDKPTPRITTDHLQPAIVGQPYSMPLSAEGGKPPYRWICNSRKLPNGLKLKKIESNDTATEESGSHWQITGTPTPQKPRNPNDPPESIAGPYSIRLRVNDDAYHARADTSPWFLPIGVTVVCLLGFWSMIRASVILFAIAIALEITLQVTGLFAVSMAAVGFQTVILLVGLANYRHMR